MVVGGIIRQPFLTKNRNNRKSDNSARSGEGSTLDPKDTKVGCQKDLVCNLIFWRRSLSILSACLSVRLSKLAYIDYYEVVFVTNHFLGKVSEGEIRKTGSAGAGYLFCLNMALNLEISHNICIGKDIY